MRAFCSLAATSSLAAEVGRELLVLLLRGLSVDLKPFDALCGRGRSFVLGAPDHVGLRLEVGVRMCIDGPAVLDKGPCSPREFCLPSRSAPGVARLPGVCDRS